jgi:hypothetical protein
MSDSQPLRRRRGPVHRWFENRLPFFYSNWITTLGSLLSLVAVALLVAALCMNVYNVLLERNTNPYIDMVTFMLLPMLLLGGLALILVGGWVQKRRKRLGVVTTVAIEVGGPEFLRKASLVGLLAVVALIALASFSYEAYHYTDSSEFCMKVCHTVMEPEGTAYERSPHANVACVKCHIGPGADWFVKAKLSGLRQVVAVMRNSYERPIPAPVTALRPARDTCEACHRPEQFLGSKLVVKEHVEPDAENTPSVSSLVIKVGGHPQPGVRATGVHWHVDPANEVRYRAVDEKRQEIVEVIQTTPEGEILYVDADADPENTEGEWRVMDCIDCHNRPTHIYETPAGALDRAFMDGLLPLEVPWLRYEADRALFAVVPGDDTAAELSAFLESAYAADHPEALELLRASLPSIGAELADILERNVFPDMAVTWGTYPTNLGHVDIEGEFDESGCFRCHDEMHVSEDGRTISQDCDACHNLLTERETDVGRLPDFVQAVLTERE